MEITDNTESIEWLLAAEPEARQRLFNVSVSVVSTQEKLTARTFLVVSPTKLRLGYLLKSQHNSVSMPNETQSYSSRKQVVIMIGQTAQEKYECA